MICDLFEVSWEEREELGFGKLKTKQVPPGIEAADSPPQYFVVVKGQCADFTAEAAHPGRVLSGQLQLDDPRANEHPAIVTPGSSVGLTVALNGSSRLDPELLSDLEALVNIYRRIDRKLGAPVIVGELSRYFERLPTLKNLSATLRMKQRLAAHAADVATLVAWQLLDMGQVEQAWGYYQSAREAAQEAGGPELHAFVVAEMSYVPLLAGYVREASTLVAHAERLSQSSVSPAFRAWLTGVRAEVCSLGRDEVKCLRMVDGRQ
ncbi:MAG: hypothetical protein ACRD0K_08495 [Egibacteraceae bacterium]